MAKLIVSHSQSIDGFVDHDRMEPEPALFRHFIESTRALSGGIYGRVIYDLMRYWDHDDPAWSDDLREFADVWRRLPKWIVSRTLTSVGSDATLIQGDLATAVREIKSSHEGEFGVGGPQLAGALTAFGLIDEYRIYVRPYVLGTGVPYFAGPVPALRLLDSERIGEGTVRLRYVPA